MNTFNFIRPLFRNALLGALLTLSLAVTAQGQGQGQGQGKGHQKSETSAAAAAPAPAPVVAPAATATTTAATSKSVPAATILPAQPAQPAQPVLTEAQRKIIQDHYASQQQRSGRCPPGLAKKNNGCLPPGQAKKWAMGQPLPADARRQPVPDAVLKKIGMVEKGIEIVRILNDVVVLNKGTRTVLDAVEILAKP
jgi:hypothetical protein